MTAKSVIVKGKVQRIGFRHFVYLLAHQWGVNGFVRNLSDGSVEIHVESSSQASLSGFLDYVKHGPGVIEEVKIEDAETQNATRFEVLESV